MNFKTKKFLDNLFKSKVSGAQEVSGDQDCVKSHIIKHVLLLFKFQ